MCYSCQYRNNEAQKQKSLRISMYINRLEMIVEQASSPVAEAEVVQRAGVRRTVPLVPDVEVVGDGLEGRRLVEQPREVGLVPQHHLICKIFIAIKTKLIFKKKLLICLKFKRRQICEKREALLRCSCQHRPTDPMSSREACVGSFNTHTHMSTSHSTLVTSALGNDKTVQSKMSQNNPPHFELKSGIAT